MVTLDSEKVTKLHSENIKKRGKLFIINSKMQQDLEQNKIKRPIEKETKQQD